MQKKILNYIGGEWTSPSGSDTFTAVNPATEEETGTYGLSEDSDIDSAVTAAKEAFAFYSRTSRQERITLLQAVLASFAKRRDELAHAVTLEIGAPQWLARGAQATLPEKHIRIAIESLASYSFDTIIGNSLVRRMPVGVCGMIAPWNWPAGTIMGKVAAALATGCTIVLKPSEYTPFTARIVADALHDAGVPPGVFNMVHGDGRAGSFLAAHPQVDCVSFTGSLASGIDVAIKAAPTVKRVLQELGGKSPNILLPSADIPRAVKEGLQGQMINSGQNCFGPSRMIVPASAMDVVRKTVAQGVAALAPGLPDSGKFMGPLAHKKQYSAVIGAIEAGLDEGAKLLAGGAHRPEGFEKGYFIAPTVFEDTAPDMRIVREEIFGPVLVLQEYRNIEEAASLALDTEYGLAAYVQGSLEEGRKLADIIPAGQVYLNSAGAAVDFSVPFGGFKRSGNGREWGRMGFDDFLEAKSIVGYYPPS